MIQSTFKRNAIALMTILGTTGFASAHTTNIRPVANSPATHSVAAVAAVARPGAEASRTQQAPPPVHPRNNIPL